MTPAPFYDAIVIGAGFYGCCLALALRKAFRRVILLDCAAEPLTRASAVNQARVHNGYHYPRNYITAWRSSRNYPRFICDFSACIDSDFEKIYAIAAHHSNVNAYQFEQFCRNVGIPLKPVTRRIRELFDHSLIEEVFSAQEVVFNVNKLRALLLRQLQSTGVELLFNVQAEAIEPHRDDYRVRLADTPPLHGRLVLNSTYAGINGLLNNSGLPLLPVKYEMAELAIIDVPVKLKRRGITVMDGPFFSTIPFPPQQLHSLSHVRYTPHASWAESTAGFPGQAAPSSTSSHFIYMIKDAQRYVPSLGSASYISSLYETKVVPLENENDDGRPILFREHLPNFYSVLGGKIDNIYEILEHLARLLETCIDEPSRVLDHG